MTLSIECAEWAVISGLGCGMRDLAVRARMKIQRFLKGIGISMLLRRVLLTIGTVVSVAVGQAQMRCPSDSRGDDVATGFVVSAGSVTMPIGAFLLVRKGTQVGAIRLTSIDSSATEWIGKSTYESFFQPDSSESLTGKNVIRQAGELDVQAAKGPGRGIYIYQPGTIRAFIGKWKFAFGSPRMMTMSDTSFWTGVGDHGFEFAPTSACNLSDVDVNGKNLKWFRYDRTTSVTLLLSDLPK
jgi:hypothetical protein